MKPITFDPKDRSETKINDHTSVLVEHIPGPGTGEITEKVVGVVEYHRPPKIDPPWRYE